MTDVQSKPTSSFLARLFERFQGLVRELGKFGTIGVISFAVDTAVFNALWHAMPTLAAGAISMTVAATVAFIGNRFWTWRDRARTDLRREYALYFLFNLCGLGIALSCLWVSHYALDFTSQLADNIAKNGVGLVLGTTFRFWSYRQIVFRKHPAEAAGNTVETAGDSAG
ncbi:MAG TPA: GtrA family protein [Dactylosporangium sp.]|nr:GtrA family protein [Dactylosporangium sp.]